MLVITLGDPFSVNCEILSQLLPQLCVPGHETVLIGARPVWKHQLSELDFQKNQIKFIDVCATDVEVAAAAQRISAEPNPSAWAPRDRGFIAKAALEKAASLTPPSTDPRRFAVLTSPVDKKALSTAGFSFPGQTEFFESSWRQSAIMILAGPKLRVGLATNHLPLQMVSECITTELLQHKIALLIKSLEMYWNIKNPRIAIAGLNPHAGDSGLFGREEIETIVPALASAKADHPHAELTGPLPADTLFYQAFSGRFDAVLAMYHDQGLGPLKTVHFDTAVNVSGGLPHLRVSPDHGPASDRFLKKTASPASFRVALALARAYLNPSGL